MSEDIGGTVKFDAAESDVTIEVRSAYRAVVKIRPNDDMADACCAAREAAASLAIARIKRTGQKRPPTGGELFWSWALPQR